MSECWHEAGVSAGRGSVDGRGVEQLLFELVHSSIGPVYLAISRKADVAPIAEENLVACPSL